jgi:DNA-binding transcriptional LysR family regulator
MDYNGLDLNLLVPLRTLLIERHVTRSAEKLGISQPAMSASLARLRALFGDQLLVRGPDGLALTSRAEALRDQLDELMEIIEHMTALPAEFLPGTSRRIFTLMGGDFVESTLLPPLMTMLAVEAPNVQIVFKQPDPKTAEASLAAGTLDLAIGYLPQAPENLVKVTLFEEPFVCIARSGHPALADGLSVDRYIELPHVQVLPRDATMYADAIDTALAISGLVRRIALWEPSFLAIPPVVARTDLISTVPRRIANEAVRCLPIVAHDLPVSLPKPEYAIYWHQRSRDDAGHRWLRQEIVKILKD